MSNVFVISVMARDRVGIVADVTGAIKNLDGNLADLSETVLRGYFTMILVASFPESVSAERVRDVLAQVQPDDPFEVGVKRAAAPLPAESDVASDREYVLTAVGPDQIGLVAAVSEYLRQKNINIVDFATCVDDGRYTMILSLVLPPGTDVAKLKHSLCVAMGDIGVQVELQHHEIFRATNEIG